MSTLQDNRRADERKATVLQIIKTMERHGITIEELSKFKPDESADKEVYQKARSLHRPTKPPKPSVEPVKVLDIKKPFTVRTL